MNEELLTSWFDFPHVRPVRFGLYECEVSHAAVVALGPDTEDTTMMLYYGRRFGTEGFWEEQKTEEGVRWVRHEVTAWRGRLQVPRVAMRSKAYPDGPAGDKYLGGRPGDPPMVKVSIPRRIVVK